MKENMRIKFVKIANIIKKVGFALEKNVVI